MATKKDKNKSIKKFVVLKKPSSNKDQTRIDGKKSFDQLLDDAIFGLGNS